MLLFLLGLRRRHAHPVTHVFSLMGIRALYISLLALCCLTLPALAQMRPRPQPSASGWTAPTSSDAPRFGIGPYAGIDYNAHRSAVEPVDGGGIPSSALDKSTCNCEFGNGSGVGATFGLRLYAPVGGIGWVSPRLLYEDRSGDFETVQLISSGSQSAQTTGSGGTPTLHVSIYEITFDLFYAQRLGFFGSYLLLGPSFSYVADAAYTMVNNGGPSGHGEYSGDFEDVRAVTYDARFGLGMSIPLSRHIAITPEALYSYPLTKISRWRDWSLRSFQATVGIVFFP
jgi:hypothetical protein